VGRGCKTATAGGGGDKRDEDGIDLGTIVDGGPDAGEEDFDAGVDGEEAPCTEPDRDAEAPLGEEGTGDRLGRLPNLSCSSA
jgi:hypothetical protein